MGGRKTLLTDVWMVHAWVVPGITCKWGVVQRRVPGAGWQARRDRSRRSLPEQVLLVAAARGLPGAPADRGRSAERRPGRAAEEPALPVVAHFERVVHPRARALHVRRELAGEQAGQPLGEVDALPQDDLAPAGRAERGLEHREQA